MPIFNAERYEKAPSLDARLDELLKRADLRAYLAERKHGCRDLPIEGDDLLSWALYARALPRARHRRILRRNLERMLDRMNRAASCGLQHRRSR